MGKAARGKCHEPLPDRFAFGPEFLRPRDPFTADAPTAQETLDAMQRRDGTGPYASPLSYHRAALLAARRADPSAQTRDVPDWRDQDTADLEEITGDGYRAAGAAGAESP